MNGSGAPPPSSSSPGSTSRYESIAPIGTGGMATVYVARARGAVGFSRLVALKRAHSHVKNDEKLAKSMKLEANLASRLQHANVVSVLDVEEDNGDLVLVLDYVEGCTLRTLTVKLEELGEKRPREILRVILDVAAGLHAAHLTTEETTGRLLGLVHRDVSPSNILVGVDGIARIADFGIAKAIVEGSERTEMGVLKGKSSYMAPEYVMHQRASAQSDLFSLAVVTWESLAARKLFKGPNEIETLKRVMRAETRPLSDFAPELAPLDAVLERALAREWTERHRSVEEMAAELERVARDHDLVATHAEVSALVERAARVELAERRRLLRMEPAPPPPPPPLDQYSDAEDLATVVAPSLREMRRASAARVVPAAGMPAGYAADPPPSSSRSEAIGPPPISQRFTPPPPSPHVPSAPMHAAMAHAPPAQHSSASTTSVPTVRGQLKDSSYGTLAESKSRGREMLALAGAFVLLGVALSLVAVQLGTAPPEEETPLPPAAAAATASTPSDTDASTSDAASTDASADASDSKLPIRTRNVIAVPPSAAPRK